MQPRDSARARPALAVLLALGLVLSGCVPMATATPVPPAIQTAEAPSAAPPSASATPSETAAPTPAPTADATPTTEASPSPTVVLAPSFSSLSMRTETTGWATEPGAGRLLRTTDGGVTWLDASPPLASDAAFTSYGFLGQDAAWAAMAEQPSGGAEAAPQVLTYHTSDGGSTWQAGATVTVPEGAVGGMVAPGQIAFVDPEHGWLLVGLGAAAGSEALAIYRTADGGATWELASLTSGMEGQSSPSALPFACNKSGVAFINEARGWATGACPGGEVFIYVTEDGGKTWTHETLPPPEGYPSDLYASCQCSLTPPQIITDQVAVLAVSVFGEQQSHVLHVTDDAGGSWTPRILPISDVLVQADLVDPQVGFVTDGSTLYVTEDAGATWTEVGALPIPPEELVGGIEFVDPQTGWVTDGQALHVTRDGGRTWSLVAPQPATLG